VLDTQLWTNVEEHSAINHWNLSVFWTAKYLTDSKTLKSLISSETKGF